MSPSQFDSEIAAPALKIKDPNWHRSHELHQECEWKQGDGGCEQNREGRKFKRLPLVGVHPCGWHDQKNLSSKGKVWKGVRLPLVGGHQLWVTRPKTKPFPPRESLEGVRLPLVGGHHCG